MAFSKIVIFDEFVNFFATRWHNLVLSIEITLIKISSSKFWTTKLIKMYFQEASSEGLKLVETSKRYERAFHLSIVEVIVFKNDD